MRGTKLTAWRIPPTWKNLQESDLTIPANSKVIQKQKLLLKETQDVLAAIAEDVRNGLLETVGVSSSFSIDDDRCSMFLDLPEEADMEQIARAIDLENVESWCDSQNRVHIGISPWYSTKDVDQTVLGAIKVIHVLLGLHAVCEVSPKGLSQKILASLIDVMKAQKQSRD